MRTARSVAYVDGSGVQVLNYLNYDEDEGQTTVNRRIHVVRKVVETSKAEGLLLRRGPRANYNLKRIPKYLG